MSEEPILPYAGSSGWSGSDTSRERAERLDSSGETATRQQMMLSALLSAGPEGMTAAELCVHYGLPTNSVAPSLTILHKAGRIARMKERRGRHEIYVMPGWVNGREVSTPGRHRQSEERDMTETAEAPAWQKGYDLEWLRALAACFKATDEGLVLGAFTGFKERDVADALAASSLRYVLEEEGGRPVAAAVIVRVNQSQAIKDFTGEERARMWPADVHVKRIGYLPGFERAAAQLLGFAAQQAKAARSSLWVQIWQEHQGLRQILAATPLRLAAVKIPASSELIGVYVAAASGAQAPTVKDLPPFEALGLRQLTLRVPPKRVADYIGAEVLPALERLPAWADHYSGYNKGHAWSALALRGYQDDPNFIIKPAEMSKAWKAEHQDLLGVGVVDTPLRAALPELERLISLVPGEHQRIRLMRLEPGGGELTRHADITDPEAGCSPGKVLRIHLPLVTNLGVLFSSWTLDGQRYEANMKVGEGWYLDTRKPHTAVNGGETARIHLVIDAFGSDDLARMLARN